MDCLRRQVVRPRAGCRLRAAVPARARHAASAHGGDPDRAAAGPAPGDAPGRSPATDPTGPRCRGAGPEKKGGNGCLKAVLIVGAIVAVLGIATFVAVAFLVNKGVDTVNDKLDAEKKVEQRTGIKSNSLNTEHPPQDDLSGDWKCTTTAGGFPQVTGTVKNNSSHTSSYAVSVEFKQNGTVFDTGSGLVVSVDPGQSAPFSATRQRPAERGSSPARSTRSTAPTSLSTPGTDPDPVAAAGPADRAGAEGPPPGMWPGSRSGWGQTCCRRPSKPLAFGSGVNRPPGGGHERPFEDHCGPSMRRS